MESTAQSSTTASRVFPPNLRAFAMVAVVSGFAAISPIATDGLWWDLARGRAVMEGSLTPSRDLLTLDELSEADWLSGVPGFLLYFTLGATALMLCRVAAAWCFLFALSRHVSSQSIVTLLPAVVVGFVLCERSFDVGPEFFDLVAAVLAIVFCSRLQSGENSTRTCIVVFLFAVVAANFAPRIAFSLLVLGVTLAVKRISVRVAASIFVAALLGSCVTPRGYLTIVDSAIVTFPWLVADSWMLETTVWRQLDVTRPNILILVFLFASVCCICFAAFKRRIQDVVFLIAIQFVVWPCSNNMPLAGAWLAFIVASHSVEFKDGSRCSKVTKAGWFSVAAFAVCTVCIAFPFSGMGWGIDARLDYRFLQIAFQDVLQPNGEAQVGSALCDDVRSAGMISWLRIPEALAQDTPQRALLHGRLKANQLLLNDIRHDRQHSYWRSDGTQGGAWLPLAGRNTRILVVSAEDTELIRGLEPGMWKPMAIDSPVLPYGQAGDVVMARKIVETLAARDVVEFGPWVYSSPTTTASHFDRDRFGLRPDIGTVETSLRQARVFRAMSLHRAAAKVLIYAVSRWDDHELRVELASNQRELAHMELLRAGEPSLFRQVALQQSIHMSNSKIDVAEELRSFQHHSSLLLPAVQNYLLGKPHMALLQLTQNTPESLYAAACLSIELGRPGDAAAYLKQVTESESGSSIGTLAEQLYEEIAP